MARLVKQKARDKIRREEETGEETNARVDKQKERNEIRNLQSTKMTRLKRFRDRIRWGPCFPCISCHQTLFSNQVKQFDENLKSLLNDKWNVDIFSRL